MKNNYQYDSQNYENSIGLAEIQKTKKTLDDL